MPEILIMKTINFRVNNAKIILKTFRIQCVGIFFLIINLRVKLI